MSEPLDVDSMRRTLARVTIYWQVCESVRAGAGSTLFNGALFIGIAYLNYNLVGLHPTVLSMGVLGVLEILVGLWKKIRPSPECIFIDGLLNVGFVLSIAFRQYLSIQAGGKPNPFSVFIGLWAAYDAFRSFQAYFQLRRVLTDRPTSEHLAYVDNLTDEILRADPAADTTALDLPTEPRLRAKLLGELAFFVDRRSGTLFLSERDRVRLIRLGDRGEGSLLVDGEQFPTFPLDDASWQNYCRWKGVDPAGSDSVPTLRPKQGI